MAYLQDLRSGGLVEAEEPLRMTPLGQRFLERYREWQEALRLLGLGPD